MNGHKTGSRSRKQQGTLVIIGGHEDKQGERAILKEVAALVENKRLVLATVASHSRGGYIADYRACFAELGITDVTELYLDDREEESLNIKLKALADTNAVFFSGGDQLRITSQIGGTKIFDRIRAIFDDGGVIAGTSAGAAAMSETMLVKGPSASSYRIGEVRMAPGLGFLPNVIIDQHFSERGRIGRLLGAVAQNPRELGVGIDENTAIIVRGDRFRVAGTGAVYLVDASGVTYSDVAEAAVNSVSTMYDVKLHVLSKGDIFDLKTRRPIHSAPAENRQKIKSRHPGK